MLLKCVRTRQKVNSAYIYFKHFGVVPLSQNPIEIWTPFSESLNARPAIHKYHYIGKFCGGKSQDRISHFPRAQRGR